MQIANYMGTVKGIAIRDIFDNAPEMSSEIVAQLDFELKPGKSASWGSTMLRVEVPNTFNAALGQRVRMTIECAEAI